MRSLLLGAALAAMALPGSAPVLADPPHGYHGRGHGPDHGRDHHDRGHYERHNYDRHYDRRHFDRGRHRGWDPAAHYRRGHYPVRRLGRYDRIYRGYDGRYYCRHSDGTAGLIVGGVLGGLLGNSLSAGGSTTLGTLLGAGGGALIGQAIARGEVRCY